MIGPNLHHSPLDATITYNHNLRVAREKSTEELRQYLGLNEGPIERFIINVFPDEVCCAIKDVLDEREVSARTQNGDVLERYRSMLRHRNCYLPFVKGNRRYRTVTRLLRMFP